MKLARDDQLAQQIAQTINAAPEGTYQFPFTADRKHLVIFDIKELSTTKVSVAPVAMSTDPAARGVNESEIEIGVSVQHRFKPSADQNDDSQIDTLKKLLEEVHDYLMTNACTVDVHGTNAEFQEATRAQLWNPETLLKDRKFEAVFKLTYRLDSDV